MYSLLDGYAKPEEYLKRAKEIGLKAFCITEHGNAYSWCYFDKLKKDYPEVKMLYGVEFYECFDRNEKNKDTKYFHLIAIARNERGRIALNELITLSELHGKYYRPRVTIHDIAPYANDLIITSACLASKLSKEVDYKKCLEYVNEYKSLFPNFYLELQAHGNNNDQEEYNHKILQLAQATNTKWIITTDSHAATKEDLYYQGRLVQIAHDSETMSETYDDCYLMSEEDIHNVLDEQIGVKAVNIGLANTNEIADMCNIVDMPFQSPKLPTFPLPEGFNDNYEYLKYSIEEGWKKRKFYKFNAEKQKIYRERIDYELDVIHQMGFDGYFLIVADFIKWCKENGNKVGAGRGSCAGSLVCYAIEITDIDPIKYGLIFQRFLNPERVSMPDTDTDVYDRSMVVDYLISKYGEERVCQIINFSFITPVVALKDVGKVLGFPYKEMDKLSKSFIYSTFEECLANNKEIADNPKYAELFDIASHLSGRVKTTSIHAGGVGIVDGKVTNFMPMKLGPEGEHVIQVDKRLVEEIGIIKYDILGVASLGLVQEAQNGAGVSDWEIDINNPDFEFDIDSYRLLSSAMTNGVFQVESAGMKDLLLRLQPSDLSQISAVLALYRPDSMGALEEYIECSKRPEKVTYVHPDMEPILRETFGCMIYQEQLLDIVRKFGGRSYGGADLFRKAIGKKNIELVKQESAKLYQEIIDNGYSKELAKQISDDLSTKGGYLFNKSHSYSYAVLCLQTAYLKCHYSKYFFNALFNMNKNKPGMINKHILDANQFDVQVLPPNINKSDMNFSVVDDKILFGYSAITGIGSTLAEQIINERNANGKFIDFNNFVERVQPTKVQTINLVKSGAIPTKNKKKFLIKYLSSLYQRSEYKPVGTLPTKAKLLLDWDIDTTQYMIGSKVDKERVLELYNAKKKAKFDEEQKAKYQDYINECNEKYLKDEAFWEFETLQIFVSDENPFAKAYEILDDFTSYGYGDKCVIVGIISKIQKKKTKTGNQFAFANIYSGDGLIEVTIWPDALQKFQNLIVKGQQVAILGKKEGEDKMIVDKIKSYDQWIKDVAKKKRAKF
jgi:DNA polymerase-3 subunit alpha